MACSKLEMMEPVYCHFYWHPIKRCKRNENCTFFHDTDHPTNHEKVMERRKRNQGKPIPPQVANFGCGGFRDRTTTLRWWIRRIGIPEERKVNQSEIVEEISDANGYCLTVKAMMDGCFREATTIAKEVKMKVKSVRQ